MHVYHESKKYLFSKLWLPGIIWIASHIMVAANDDKIKIRIIAKVGVNQPASWNTTGKITWKLCNYAECGQIECRNKNVTILTCIEYRRLLLPDQCQQYRYNCHYHYSYRYDHHGITVITTITTLLCPAVFADDVIHITTTLSMQTLTIQRNTRFKPCRVQCGCWELAQRSPKPWWSCVQTTAQVILLLFALFLIL